MREAAAIKKMSLKARLVCKFFNLKGLVGVVLLKKKIVDLKKNDKLLLRVSLSILLGPILQIGNNTVFFEHQTGMGVQG